MTTWYTGAALPSGREPSSSQMSDMEEAWTEDNVTAAGTVGTVGMFGYDNSSCDMQWGNCEDEYYFYMKF